MSLMRARVNGNAFEFEEMLGLSKCKSNLDHFLGSHLLFVDVHAKMNTFNLIPAPKVGDVADDPQSRAVSTSDVWTAGSYEPPLLLNLA